MSTDRPNILLIMTDQQRGDCLGAAGHPVLQTPQMDELAGNGVRFGRAFSTCPSCIAARRSLLSGQTPQTHGLVGYRDKLEWNPPATLPDELRKAGYQTAIVGRNMHQFPFRKRYGYETMTISGSVQGGGADDYSLFIKQQAGHHASPYSAGPGNNDWTARPWHLPEPLHPTNWTVDCALDFLARRDPTVPYFLTVSFLAPHPPLVPPAFYMDRYRRMDLPRPAMGDWCSPPPRPNMPVSASRIDLHPEAHASMLAGYYGLINHVDDQLRRLFNPALSSLGRNTLVIFTSDHGEMLGDHYMFRKSEPYQGSANIPMIFSGPSLGITGNRLCNQAVCLEDIMPTCLDIAGLPIPASVEGRSLLPVLRGEDAPLSRDFLHGEHAPNAHYLTDGRYKYVWRVADGSEQLFDLDHDPQELRNLVNLPDHASLADHWRQRLIKRLEARPEGFVEQGRLVAGKRYAPALPHAE